MAENIGVYYTQRFDIITGYESIPIGSIHSFYVITNMWYSNIFEAIADQTWNRLESSLSLGISFSEETITEMNLLDLRVANLDDVWISQAKGRDEPEKGFDWEWWIGSQSSGWWRYSVQAKKLKRDNTPKGSYSSIRHEVDGKQQIDILEDFARSQRTVPLYCFYNYKKIKNVYKYWNCPRPVEPKQLGCSIASLEATRTIHEKHKRKSFEKLHKNEGVLPLRCLLVCPMINNKYYDHPLQLPGLETRKHENIPDFLVNDSESHVDITNDMYYSELGGYPENIMVLNTS